MGREREQMFTSLSELHRLPAEATRSISRRSYYPLSLSLSLAKSIFIRNRLIERITSSQRMAASSVLDAHSSDVDGEPYWYYEYLIRKSPTKTARESNLYRHYISSTAERDGYLYSLSASTLSKQWDAENLVVHLPRMNLAWTWIRVILLGHPIHHHLQVNNQRILCCYLGNIVMTS